MIYYSSTLNSNFYDEIHSHKDWSKYSLTIVVVVAICTGIGTLQVTEPESITKEIVFSLFGWFLWGLIIYVIGVKFFKYESTLNDLLRYLGFAYSPGIVNILGLVPKLDYLIILISFLWIIFTFIYAITKSLKCTPPMAILIVLIGVIPYVIIRFFILAYR